MKKGIIVTCLARHQETKGGAFKLAGEFAAHLAGAGYRVHYVCGSTAPVAPEPLMEGGVKFWRYPFPKAASPSWRNLTAHWSSTSAIIRNIVKQEKIEVINGHTPVQYAAAVGAVSRGHQVPRLVYSVHSPFVEELRADWLGDDQPASSALQRRFKQFIALKLAAWIERRVYRVSHAIQTDSQFTADVISRSYPQEVGTKVRVVPGWVDLDRFRPTADRLRLRAQLGGPWDCPLPVFLSIRRLERRMGLDNLIAACRQLDQEGFRFRLLLGGVGSMRAALEGQIRTAQLTGTVQLLGRVPDEQLPLAYAAADCFVLPTRALECFGLIVLEAHAAGTPVIATPVGAIPEVMGEFGREWLTVDDSPRAIVDKLRQFLRGQLITDNSHLRRNAERYQQEVVLAQLASYVLG